MKKMEKPRHQKDLKSLEIMSISVATSQVFTVLNNEIIIINSSRSRGGGGGLTTTSNSSSSSCVREEWLEANCT